MGNFYKDVTVKIYKDNKEQVYENVSIEVHEHSLRFEQGENHIELPNDSKIKIVSYFIESNFTDNENI